MKTLNFLGLSIVRTHKLDNVLQEMDERRKEMHQDSRELVQLRETHTSTVKERDNYKAQLSEVNLELMKESDLLRAARSQVEHERKVNEGLRAELRNVYTELETYRMLGGDFEHLEQTPVEAELDTSKAEAAEDSEVPEVTEDPTNSTEEGK